MSSFMTKVKHGGAVVVHVNDRRGFAGYVIDKTERWGGAAGFGYMKGYYREKASFHGQPLDKLIGFGLVAAAAGLEVWTGGRSKLAPHLNAVGDAGVMSWLGSKFTGMGGRHSGRTAYVLDAGAVPPKNLPAGLREVVGMDDPIGGGAYLSADQVLKHANSL